MSTYLVTGGAGFIGSHLVEELIRRKESVRVLDNFLTGKRSNIEPFLSKIELIEGDLCNLDTVKKAVKGVDYILHQGALPSVPRSVSDPLKSHEVNTTGTVNVLIAARDAKVKRVVYAASSSAYGDTPGLPRVETMPTRPLSPYAITKLVGEEYCRVFTKIYGLSTVSLRYFNVFGPRQDPASQYAAVIPKFITSLLAKKAPVIYGDGEQSRDFTYVNNVVQANLLACEAKDVDGEMFNTACGNAFTLNQLIKELQEICHTQIAPTYEDSRTGDVKHSLADITKAKKLLHYEPKISFHEGLKKTVRWFISQNKTNS